jgi:hypothetical protein
MALVQVHISMSTDMQQHGLNKRRKIKMQMDSHDDPSAVLKTSEHQMTVRARYLLLEEERSRLQTSFDARTHHPKQTSIPADNLGCTQKAIGPWKFCPEMEFSCVPSPVPRVHCRRHAKANNLFTKTKE